MDKYGSVDQNWYSSEAQKSEKEKAEIALTEAKEREKLYKKSGPSLLRGQRLEESENDTSKKYENK